MMRITSGEAKNTTLIAPDIPKFRAVQDVVKQAVFAILGEKIVGAVCLDLFAGSGSFGLEALSRGAESCDFVEENHICRDVILQNINKCHYVTQSKVYLRTAGKFVEKFAEDAGYDLIFMDPFYDDHQNKHLLKNLKRIAKPDGMVVYTHGNDLDLTAQIEDTDLKLITQRRFGAAVVSILNILVV